MTAAEAALVLLAGMAAGAINAVVGSGTLLTFPTLLAVGYPPVLANVSNTVGLFLGSASAAYGYRTELAGQRPRLTRLGSASFLGAVTGAVLLLVLPEDAFSTIVPVLISLAVVLVLAGPLVNRRLPPPVDAASARGGPWLWLGVYGAGVYGGYFGAAQGVLLIALLSFGLRDDLQRVNAAKNALAFLVNVVAAVLFVIVAEVAWAPAGLIAVGSIIGGLAGARVGRRLPPWSLRVFVAVVGVVALVRLLGD